MFTCLSHMDQLVSKPLDCLWPWSTISLLWEPVHRVTKDCGASVRLAQKRRPISEDIGYTYIFRVDNVGNVNTIETSAFRKSM
jgi:hypothetical protein